MVGRQGFSVPGEGLPDVRLDLSRGVIFPVEDCRELVFDHRRAARRIYELWEEAFGGAARTRLRRTLDRAPADSGILDARDQHLCLESEVPQVEHLHLAQLGHAFAVGPDTTEGRILGSGFGKAVVAAGDHEARRETLEVPLPGRREGLIEVVNG